MKEAVMASPDLLAHGGQPAMTMDRRALYAIIRQPRNFLGNHFVYAVISERAGGLSIGINMNPDQKCNFDCLYCEVERMPSHKGARVDVRAMVKELKTILGVLQLGRIREFFGFSHVPQELLQLKHVALSGNGEPTYCPNFAEVVREVMRVRQMPQFPSFKLVLITNGTGLHRSPIQDGLRLFSASDEIWVKLDAGTQNSMELVNQTSVPLEQVLSNILAVGRSRPVIIQSLFASIHGRGPGDDEIEAYVQRLVDLKKAGAQIASVQVYSVARPPARPGCAHLPLSRLSYIARRVRETAKLKAEVY